MSIRMMPMDYVQPLPAPGARHRRQDGQADRTADLRPRHRTGQEPDRAHHRSADAPGAQQPGPRHRDARERVASGKDPVGQLVLSAQHNGGNIVIEVSDDGAGLNREKILKKAMSQGPAGHEVSDDGAGLNREDPEEGHVAGPAGQRNSPDDEIRRPEPREDPEEGHVAGPAGQRKLARRRNLATDLRAPRPRRSRTSPVVAWAWTWCAGTSRTWVATCSCRREPGKGRARDTVRASTCRWSRCTACSPWAAQTDPTQAIAVIMQAEDPFALLVDHLIGQHQVVVRISSPITARCPAFPRPPSWAMAAWP